MADLMSDADESITVAASSGMPGKEDSLVQASPLSKTRRKLSKIGSRPWFNKSFDQNILQQPLKQAQPRIIRRQNSVTDFFQNVLSKSKSHLQDIFALKKEKPKHKSAAVGDCVKDPTTFDLKIKNVDVNGAEGGCNHYPNQGINPEIQHSALYTSCPSLFENEEDITQPVILKTFGSLKKDNKARVREKRRLTNSVKVTLPTELSATLNMFIVTESGSLGARHEEPEVDSQYRPIVKKQSRQLSKSFFGSSIVKLKSSTASLVFPNSEKHIQCSSFLSNENQVSKIAILSPLGFSFNATEDGSVTSRKVSSAPPSRQSGSDDIVNWTKLALVKSNSDTITKYSSSPQLLGKASFDRSYFKVSTPSSLTSSMTSLGNIMISVTDYLFLGSVEAAYNEPLLCKYNISSLIDMTNVNPTFVPPNKKSDCPCACVNKTHFRSKLNIGIDDIEWENLEQYFNDINAFIHGARRKGRRVLVFSYMGQSRAPAAVIQHIMHHFQMPYKKALKIVRAKRPQTQINSGFVKALLRLDEQLELHDSGTEIGIVDVKRPDEYQMVPSGTVERLDGLSAPPVVRGAWSEC